MFAGCWWRGINVCMVVAGGHDQVRPGHAKVRCVWPCGHCGVHVSTVGRLAKSGRWTCPGQTGGRVVVWPWSNWWPFRWCIALCCFTT